MSVVAIKINEKTIDICADSIMVNGYIKDTTSSFSKINEDNGMVIGGVGTASELSMMWEYMSRTKPESATEIGVQRFLLGFRDDAKRAISKFSNYYIIIYKGKAFSVNDLFVREITKYEAIGAGWIEATTAMYLGHSAEEAVKTSCDMNCFVCEPIIKITKSRKKD